MQPSGILIDFDGTLCNSKKILFGVFYEFCDLNKIDHSNISISSFDGLTIQEIISTLFESELELKKLQKLEKKYNEMIDSYFHEAVIFEGSKAFIEKCSKLKIKLGIVTSNSKERVTKFLKKYDLYECFNVLITREEYLNSKPDPEPYNVALQKIMLPPEKCIAIEDSIIGVKAAISAGLSCYLFDPDSEIKNISFRDKAKSISRFDQIILGD